MYSVRLSETNPGERESGERQCEHERKVSWRRVSSWLAHINLQLRSSGRLIRGRARYAWPKAA